MKKNKIIFSAVLILIIGIFFSLKNTNKEVTNSFAIYKISSKLKNINYYIDNFTNSSGIKNYDIVNHYIAAGDGLLNKIQRLIDQSHVEDKNILSYFDKLKKDFRVKADLIEQYKASNSIVNNSYRNTLQLFDIVQKQVDINDRVVLDGFLHDFFSLDKTRKILDNNKIKKLLFDKYKSNDMMQLLDKNILLYQLNTIKIKKLQKKIKQQKLIVIIDNFTNYYTSYNQKLLDINIIIMFVLIAILLFILLLSYLLTKTLENTHALLESKTIELEDSLLIINQNVIMSQTDLSGKIISASDAFCEISKYTRDELIGKQHSIVRHPDMKSESFEKMWKAIKQDKTWKGEVKNLTKDGGFYWVDAVIAPLIKDGVKIGYTSIRHNISDKKIIDELNTSLKDKIKQEVEKNRQKDQQIVQQSRLAQMGEMISMIAHQWRQPLSAISSTSGAINLKAKLNKLDSQQAVELSEKISDYSQHLSSTIDDFREFFKPNKLKSKITYSEIIDSVLGIVKISIESKNITIVKNLNSQVIFNTYQNELKQVLLNLIQNAEDVLLEKDIVNPTITIETKENILIVSDNGGGIADDIIDKVFDPYFSTKTQKDGTGLGLYMSKIIIEEHCNGKISVSNDNDGAKFIIELRD